MRQFENVAKITSQGSVAAWGLTAFAKLALMTGPLHLSIREESIATGDAYDLKISR